MATPETSAEQPPRLTSRQRRIEEQRRRIDTMHREQRRKRAIWGTAILIAFVVVAFLAWTFLKPPPSVPAQGRQYPAEGRDHVADGAPMQYRTRPPSSGNHYGQSAPYGVFERELATGNWVHTLEHGAIVVLYRPDLCDQDCVGQLRDVYQSAPRGKYGAVKMSVLPYRDMDHAVATVAWTWIDEMDQVDKERIVAFYRAHVDRGPEDTQ